MAFGLGHKKASNGGAQPAGNWRDGDQRFKVIVENLQDGVVLFDEQFNIQLINSAAARLAGWTVDEVSSFGSGPPRYGVSAALGASPADRAVRRAFGVIGFQFLEAPDDAGVTRTPELFVGIPASASPAPPSQGPSPGARP